MSGRPRPTRGPRRAELSQHFLRATTAERIVRDLPLQPTDLVVEIGAGRGALTKPLSRRAGHVIAVEIDGYLAARLECRCAANVEVARADILTYALPCAAHSVVGNIPYAIGNDLVTRLVAADPAPTDLWLIVQREFAEQLCGRPYRRESQRSLALKPTWHVEVLERLKRTDFDPPPKVDSVLLHLQRRLRPLLAPPQQRLFERLTRHAIGGPPDLQRALRTWLSKVQLRRLGADLRFSVQSHPAELSFEQWLGVLRFVERARPDLL